MKTTFVKRGQKINFWKTSKCWLSTIYDEDDTEAGKLVDLVNGDSPGANVNSIQLDSSTNQARISFEADNILSSVSSPAIFVQCEVFICSDNDVTCGSGDASRISAELEIDLTVGTTACNSANCGGSCVATFSGAQCTCPNGQSLQPDNSCVRKRKWPGKWKKKTG